MTASDPGPPKEPTESARLAFSDDLQRACRYCATVSYIRLQRLMTNPLPTPDELTATVTFIRFEDATYAVTAGHVVKDFRATTDDPSKHTFFVPTAPGHTLFDRFFLPPAGLIGKAPDIAIMRISPELPTHLGKEAFLLEGEQPENFHYALAVGFPTARKEARSTGEIALECCHAIAEGVTTGFGDQVQFYSELSNNPSVSSLSGMSGGPVFWSDGNSSGLIGLVKQAMDGTSEQSFAQTPIVHFICQRFSTAEFGAWVSMLPTR